jgi:hypothetical protein
LQILGESDELPAESWRGFTLTSVRASFQFLPIEPKSIHRP